MPLINMFSLNCIVKVLASQKYSYQIPSYWYDMLSYSIVFNIQCMYSCMCLVFFTQVSQWYELVVFTASMEIYGAAVADKLDNNRNILRRRYYRQVFL